MTPSAPVLEVDGVDVALGHHRAAVPILHDVSLTVAAGEIVGLIGETGSGKTTLARTILGINRPTAGDVRIGDTPVSRLRGRELRAFRRAGDVQFVFQDPLRSLDPDLRVGTIVGEGLSTRGGLSTGEIAKRSHEALAQVGLDYRTATRHPAQLSGGQRQRVAIARALAGGPRLLVCDEPVSALDASSRNQILALLDDLRTRLGIGVLVISHDLSSLAAVADRIAVMSRGRVLEDGPTEQVLGEASHPYSALLVASAPTLGDDDRLPAARLRRADGDDADRSPVDGSVGGCGFASRCPFATAECATRPPLRELRAGTRVACHHAETWRAQVAGEPGPTAAPGARADEPVPIAVAAR